MVAPLWPESRGYISPERSITSCVGAVRGSRSSKSWRRVTPRSSGVERIRKAGKGVGEQTGVAWVVETLYDSLRKGRRPKRSIRFVWPQNLVTPKSRTVQTSARRSHSGRVGDFFRRCRISSEKSVHCSYIERPMVCVHPEFGQFDLAKRARLILD